MKRELTISPQPGLCVGMFHIPLFKAVTHHWYIVPYICRPKMRAHSNGEIATTGGRWLGSLSQDDIQHLYDSLHVTIHACVVAIGSYTVYWWLDTPYYDLSMWSEFVIIYSYNDKLPVVSICNTTNLSFRVLPSFSCHVQYFVN